MNSDLSYAPDCDFNYKNIIYPNALFFKYVYLGDLLSLCRLIISAKDWLAGKILCMKADIPND